VQRSATPISHSSGDPVALDFGKVIRLTYLSSAVSDSSPGMQDTLQVGSPDGFPLGRPPTDPTNPKTAEPILIRIDQEQMQLIDGFNTTTWTVLRGANGTTAAHAQNAVVSQSSPTSFAQTVTFQAATTVDPNHPARMLSAGGTVAQSLLASFSQLFNISTDPSTGNILPLMIHPPLYLRDPAHGADWVVAFGGVLMSFPTAQDQSRQVVTLQRHYGGEIPPQPAQQIPPMQQQLQQARQSNGSIASSNASATPQVALPAIQALESLGLLTQEGVGPLLSSLLLSRAGTMMPVLAPALVRSE
jgi:hypothetical protein